MRGFLVRHWRAVLVWGMSACFLLGGLLLVWVMTLQVPDLASIENRKVEQSVKIYDRTGEVVLYDLNTEARRTIVPIAQVSQNIQNATVAIEDPEFYTHLGVKPTAIVRAVLTNLMEGNLLGGQGGSTITQQVVKMYLLTGKKSIARKVEEWALSLKLERSLSKDQILELYLNQAPYGGSIYGVEQAALTFFGKHASDISIPEAAYLAAVLPAPSYYSPYGNHKDALDNRKNLVLQKMHEHGFITEDELATAKTAEVTFVPQRTSSISAPHFVFYVEQYLENKYGRDALLQGGWSVVTSLDADLQTRAEEIVQSYAAGNQANFNASNTGMIAIDPTTGQILVMVGSRNYFDKTIDGNFNVTLAPRQPGSAFKPFAYAKAFDKGYSPDTVLFDLPTQFSTSCKPEDSTNDEPPCYSPGNYDGKFRGPMTLRDALAQSINIPAVKVLYLAGLNDTLKLAKSMGLSTLGQAGRYGLTLVLGGGEVTLLEMTSAYGAFAQDGTHYSPVAVLQVKDGSGNVIEDNTQSSGTQVLSREVAQKVNDVLSDTVAREPLGNTALNFPGYEVAVKTGTTNDYRDAWTIGYTPNIVVGIWAGNNDNSSMVKKVSGLIVGPMWHDFMAYALGKTPNVPFSRTDSGPSPKPSIAGQWQIPGNDGTVHDLLYWVDKDNPMGPPPGNNNQDPQFLYWDIPVRRWATEHGLTNLPPVNPQSLPQGSGF